MKRVFGIGIALGVSIPFVISFMYDKNMKLLYARSIEQNNGKEMTNIIQFYEDEVVMRNFQTGMVNSFPYSTIRGITESKNLIFVITTAKTIMIIEKAKITLGNNKELIDFIKTKC